MTEQEARTKWCPMVRANISGNSNGAFNRDGDDCACIASDCIMWRWVPAGEYIDGDRLVQQWRTEGYCGAGGKIRD